MTQLFYSIFETLIIILSTFSLLPIHKKWRETKNRMYLAVIALIVGIMVYSIVNLISLLSDFDTTVYLIGGLRFGYVLGYMLATIQFEFMLYLKRLIKFYTLPLITGAYLILGHILVINSIPFIIYLAFIGYIPPFILLIDGKRNHNGLAFGIGFLFLLWGIGQSIPEITTSTIFRTVAVFLLLLGTIGFYEKYLFSIEEDEKKILGTWISKIVVKK